MGAAVFPWLLSSSLILSSSAIQVFNFNATYHPKDAICTDKKECQFNCIGKEVCHRDVQTRLHCAPKANCSVVCHGNSACEGVNIFCPVDGDCQVELNGNSAMYDSHIHAESSSKLSVSAQGDQSMGWNYVTCPINNAHPSDPNCVIRLKRDPSATYEHGILTNAKFFVANESSLQFECEGANDSELFGQGVFGVSKNTAPTQLCDRMVFDKASQNITCTDKHNTFRCFTISVIRRQHHFQHHRQQHHRRQHHRHQHHRQHHRQQHHRQHHRHLRCQQQYQRMMHGWTHWDLHY